ncbi:hypothetical protein DWG96_23820 [Escherichia coli]|nr:hypothetical protein [Escherichia coli]
MVIWPVLLNPVNKNPANNLPAQPPVAMAGGPCAGGTDNEAGLFFPDLASAAVMFRGSHLHRNFHAISIPIFV